MRQPAPQAPHGRRGAPSLTGRKRLNSYVASLMSACALQTFPGATGTPAMAGRCIAPLPISSPGTGRSLSQAQPRSVRLQLPLHRAAQRRFQHRSVPACSKRQPRINDRARCVHRLRPYLSLSPDVRSATAIGLVEGLSQTPLTKRRVQTGSQP